MAQLMNRRLVDTIYDAIDTGTALTIETDRRVYEDCAVLRTSDTHVTFSAFDAVKDVMREYDIAWESIQAVEQF